MRLKETKKSPGAAGFIRQDAGQARGRLAATYSPARAEALTLTPATTTYGRMRELPLAARSRSLSQNTPRSPASENVRSNLAQTSSMAPAHQETTDRSGAGLRQLVDAV